VSEKHVFVVENGKAVRRGVEVGSRTETAVHVVSGLKAGEWVITTGIQQLRGGLAVNVGDSARHGPR
jgi:membrane fusion protein (multidrug efflux system)